MPGSSRSSMNGKGLTRHCECRPLSSVLALLLAECGSRQLYIICIQQQVLLFLLYASCLVQCRRCSQCGKERLSLCLLSSRLSRVVVRGNAKFCSVPERAEAWWCLCFKKGGLCMCLIKVIAALPRLLVSADQDDFNIALDRSALSTLHYFDDTSSCSLHVNHITRLLRVEVWVIISSRDLKPHLVCVNHMLLLRLPSFPLLLPYTKW